MSMQATAKKRCLLQARQIGITGSAKRITGQISTVLPWKAASSHNSISSRPPPAIRKPTKDFRCFQYSKPPEKPTGRLQDTSSAGTSTEVKGQQRAREIRSSAIQRVKTAFFQRAPDESAIFQCRRKSVFPE